MINLRIIIANAHFLPAYGLSQLIRERSGWEVVAIVGSEEQLFSALQKEKADLVILDYLQSGAFSVNTIGKLRKQAPEVKVLIISEDHRRKRVFDVLESQVDGYITKGCEKEEVMDAIQSVGKGGRFYCNSVLNYLLEKSFGKQDDSCLPTQLSPREIEIVQLIAQGLIAKEIAAELNLSPHTVYTHRKNIMRKLGIKSTSELVLHALELGIIDAVQ